MKRPRKSTNKVLLASLITILTATFCVASYIGARSIWEEMNEPSNVPLRRLQARAEAEGIPIQFEAVSYVNLDYDIWIGVARSLDQKRLKNAGFKYVDLRSGLSLAMKERVTVAWRRSQSTTFLVGFTLGKPSSERVKRMIDKLQ